MNDLPVYFMHDQPHCCPECGLRTAFYEAPDGSQLHKCTCGFAFRVEEEVISLTPEQRQHIIEALMGDCISSVLADTSYVYDVFRFGHKGFHNYTDDELVKEYVDAFDEDPLGEEDDE